jgi:hypothetical protein
MIGEHDSYPHRLNGESVSLSCSGGCRKACCLTAALHSNRTQIVDNLITDTVARNLAFGNGDPRQCLRIMCH